MLNLCRPTAQLTSDQRDALEALLGARMQADAPLARYTSARVGGSADLLLEVRSANELAQVAEWLWEWGLPFRILGGGSNVLVSDAGARGVVVLNRARRVHFEDGEALRAKGQSPWVRAESGANFGLLARQAAQRGLAGLEWASGIPGTLGGAVVGNAGAHGGDIAGNLLLAEILHRHGVGQVHREEWPQARFEFGYRSSLLKRRSLRNALRTTREIVLSAGLRLEWSSAEAVQARTERFVAHRRVTQPPGASMGSMFKNPPGDYAGRLIEAAGLKGAQIGQAEISPLHANFFINHGAATAGQIYELIQLAQATVAEKLGVNLELEIELFGDWES